MQFAGLSIRSRAAKSNSFVSEFQGCVNSSANLQVACRARTQVTELGNWIILTMERGEGDVKLGSLGAIVVNPVGAAIEHF